MPKRLPRTVTVDYSQHNPRIQLTLAECLLGLGFEIPGGIHPGTTSGTDIVVQWPGRPATMHIEVEVIKSGSLKTKIPQWLRKLNAAADARSLVIVVHDTGWARTLIQSNPKPVHCVAFEDWAHLVPTLACHYLLH